MSQEPPTNRMKLPGEGIVARLSGKSKLATGLYRQAGDWMELKFEFTFRGRASNALIVSDSREAWCHR